MHREIDDMMMPKANFVPDIQRWATPLDGILNIREGSPA